jgi:hypothetical protein
MEDKILKPDPRLAPTVPLHKDSFFHRHIMAEVVAILLIAATISIVYYISSDLPKADTYTPVIRSQSSNTWKTYTNSQYGFEFRYPGDWTLGISGYIISEPDFLFRAGVYDPKEPIDPDNFKIPLKIGVVKTNSTKCITAKEYSQSQIADLQMGEGAGDITIPEKARSECRCLGV